MRRAASLLLMLIAIDGNVGAQPLAPVKLPEAGTLLVATASSHDPDLAKSVVLIVHEGPEGVIGLILNRPEKDAFFGGPIPIGIRMLVRAQHPPPNAEHVFGYFYVVDVKRLPREGSRARIYAGYVGWSPEQLVSEISRGLWRTLPASASIIADANPATLWQRLIR